MHNIEYITCSEKADRKKVKAELDDYVAREDWEEGCEGLYEPIRWYDNEPVKDSYNEAEEFLKRNYRGDYDNLAVRFYLFDPDTQKTRKICALEDKVKAADEKYYEMNTKAHFADAKSEYVGCKACGSKINREKLLEKARPNFCPVCGADLRPESIKEKLTSMKETSDGLKKELADEKAKQAKKGRKVNWLVRFEYHT